MEKIYTEWRQGATKGMNIGGYATPSGVGVGLHRLPMKLGANDVESQANTKVARAFGHTLESKARKIASSPGEQGLGRQYPFASYTRFDWLQR